jgi:hypothetical protein
MRSNVLRTLSAAAGVLASAGACHADTVEIFGVTGSSTEGLGDFTGSITYTPTMDDMGTLLVSLTNTSPMANGGFITAFVFNIASSDSDASAMLLSGPANFVGISDVNAQPFGMNFDAGASTSGGPAPFEGGGNPSLGLGVGDTGEFEFKITADDAASLMADDFITNGPFDFNFVVRFRGFEDNGSDKVPGAVIPLPSVAAMGGIGLLGLGLKRRRRDLN